MKKVLLALVAISLVACGTPEEKYMSKVCDTVDDAISIIEGADGDQKKIEEATSGMQKEAEDYGKDLGLDKKAMDSLAQAAMKEKCPDAMGKLMGAAMKAAGAGK